jgi:aspartate ammonia-lyase
MSSSFVRALVMVKKAVAFAYKKLEETVAFGKAEICLAIAGDCDHILAVETIKPLFPVDALQGGAGTSTNMNVNDILANLAHTASLRLSEKYPKHKQCAIIILLWPDINILINPRDYS